MSEAQFYLLKILRQRGFLSQLVQDKFTDHRRISEKITTTQRKGHLVNNYTGLRRKSEVRKNFSELFPINLELPEKKIGPVMATKELFSNFFFKMRRSPFWAERNGRESNLIDILHVKIGNDLY